MKQQTKEIVQTVVVVVVAAVLIFFYWVYPLNRAKAMWGRTDIATFNKDSLLAKPNDPAPFQAASILIDTFRVDVDRTTIIAGVLLRGASTPAPRGTIILVPSENETRSTVAPLAKQLVDSGFTVVTFDQRAGGLSTGKYHSDGRMEGSDLEALVAHLGLHNQLTSPVVVVGWKNGGDAALLAQVDEKRITAVLAVEPYITSTRFLDAYKARYSPYWFPFYRTLMWFWLNARSSYGLAYNHGENMTAVGGRATIMLPDSAKQDPAVAALAAKSGAALTLAPVESEQNNLTAVIVSLATAAARSN